MKKIRFNTINSEILSVIIDCRTFLALTTTINKCGRDRGKRFMPRLANGNNTYFM